MGVTSLVSLKGRYFEGQADYCRNLAAKDLYLGRKGSFLNLFRSHKLPLSVFLSFSKEKNCLLH